MTHSRLWTTTAALTLATAAAAFAQKPSPAKPAPAKPAATTPEKTKIDETKGALNKALEGQKNLPQGADLEKLKKSGEEALERLKKDGGSVVNEAEKAARALMNKDKAPSPSGAIKKAADSGKTGIPFPSPRIPGRPSSDAVEGTTVTAEGSAFYGSSESDPNQTIMVFVKNVYFERADMKIWCEYLEAFLEGDPAGAGDKSKEAPKKDPKKMFKRVIAKGPPVIIVRGTGEEQVIMIAKEAVFDGKTGNVILKGLPEFATAQHWGRGLSEASEITIGSGAKPTFLGQPQPELHFNEADKAGAKRREILSKVPAPPDPNKPASSGPKPAEKVTPSSPASEKPAPAPKNN